MTVPNGGSLRDSATHHNRIGEGTRLKWRIHSFAEKHKKDGVLEKDRGSHLHISHSYAAVLMGTRIGALVARVMSISRLGEERGGNGTME